MPPTTAPTSAPAAALTTPESAGQHPRPVFYSLPVTSVKIGMSTREGHDVLDVSEPYFALGGDEFIDLVVYTPRPDDPALDAENRSAADTWLVPAGNRVELAVFGHTTVDGSTRTDSEPITAQD